MASVNDIFNGNEGIDEAAFMEWKKNLNNYKENLNSPITQINEKYENCLKNAAKIIKKDENFSYKPAKDINDTTTENTDYESMREEYYYGWSKKYNLHRYVYGRLFASVYKNNRTESFIEENTSKIYSWINFLRGYEKNNNIYYFNIRNIDERNSRLLFAFNMNNIVEQYTDYLEAIAYCIDNNI